MNRLLVRWQKLLRKYMLLSIKLKKMPVMNRNSCIFAGLPTTIGDLREEGCAFASFA
ncbi:hypothetical protein ACTHRH_01680 [Paenibacillus sp. SAFN-117]